MRALSVLLVLPMLACAAARPSVPSAVAEREILDLERAWDDAEVRRDAAALDAMMDDRFLFTYGGDEPLDKATVIKNVLAADKPSPSTPSEQHVTIDGDVAIATGVDTFDGVVDGKPARKANRYTATWAHRGGRWRALAVHMMAVAPATPADSVPKTTERELLRHGIPSEFGDKSNATLFEVSYPPGGFTRPHRHPCPVVGYVVEGALRMQMEGGAERTYRAGEAFYEGPNDIHRVSANASSNAVAKFLAFFVCRDDVSLAPIPVTVAPPAATGGAP